MEDELYFVTYLLSLKILDIHSSERMVSQIYLKFLGMFLADKRLVAYGARHILSSWWTSVA
jgi:hypothetical protein